MPYTLFFSVVLDRGCDDLLYYITTSPLTTLWTIYHIASYDLLYNFITSPVMIFCTILPHPCDDLFTILPDPCDDLLYYFTTHPFRGIIFIIRKSHMGGTAGSK